MPVDITAAVIPGAKGYAPSTQIKQTKRLEFGAEKVYWRVNQEQVAQVSKHLNSPVVWADSFYRQNLGQGWRYVALF